METSIRSRSHLELLTLRGIAYICEHSKKGLALVARAGSHSLFSAILAEFYGDIRPPENDHPFRVTPNLTDMALTGTLGRNIAVMVRDPVERFRSACARQKTKVGEGLLLRDKDVHFWSLESMGVLGDEFVHFKFPQQLQECASWLGINKKVLLLNSEPESKKPILSSEEIQKVSEAYAEDIHFWRSLT